MRDVIAVIVSCLQIDPRSSAKTSRGKASGFLAGGSRLFIRDLTLFLTQPSPWATLQDRPTVSEPPFRHYGNRFFECARVTAAIFPENFYRGPVRPVDRTCVQVVTSWPPQFGSFLTPLLLLPPFRQLATSQFRGTICEGRKCAS